MTVTKTVSIALVAGTAAGSSVAWAQSTGVTMLVPGVYTTPEISRKCQEYARKRVDTSSNSSNMRQSALACARKLWEQQQAKNKKDMAT